MDQQHEWKLFCKFCKERTKHMEILQHLWKCMVCGEYYKEVSHDIQ